MRIHIFDTKGPASLILIRILLGSIFVSEGIQKFLFPELLGAGRFLKIGIPMPEFSATFTGVFEITCGLLLRLGLATRLVAVPLFCIMCVAIMSTKGSVLINQGFWVTAHEARTDISMLFCLVFIFINGSGRLSIDNLIGKRLRD